MLSISRQFTYNCFPNNVVSNSNISTWFILTEWWLDALLGSIPRLDRQTRLLRPFGGDFPNPNCHLRWHGGAIIYSEYHLYRQIISNNHVYWYIYIYIYMAQPSNLPRPPIMVMVLYVRCMEAYLLWSSRWLLASRTGFGHPGWLRIPGAPPWLSEIDQRQLIWLSGLCPRPPEGWVGAG